MVPMTVSSDFPATYQ